jgi:sporulation protein YlmC with PRC-barrel domain
MVESTVFTIGVEARCSDGVCGRLSQVVVDPLGRTVTHLVVEPDHREGLGRLVPVELAKAGADGMRLSCTLAEFAQLERAERTWFLPGVDDDQGYGSDEMLLWPYFGGNTTMPVTFDSLPLGEVAVRRGEQVHATDGHIGKVQGLVVDPGSHHVSQVLLEEGHLWGRKEVAVPITAVSAVGEDGIRLGISKAEVQDLPAVELDRTTG